MQLSQERMLYAGQRVQPFLDVHRDQLDGKPPASLRAKLDAAIVDLVRFQREQSTADSQARGEGVNQDRLRQDLYDRFIVSNARVAQLLLAETPEFGALNVPQSVLSAPNFVATVEQFREAAAVHEAVLVENGMAEGFLGEIDAAVAAVVTSAATRARLLARRKAATEGCNQATKMVRSYIGIIDGVLRPVLKKDPTLLRDWLASKKVPQTPASPLSTGSLDMGDDSTDSGNADAPGDSASGSAAIPPATGANPQA